MEAHRVFSVTLSRALDDKHTLGYPDHDSGWRFARNEEKLAAHFLYKGAHKSALSDVLCRGNLCVRATHADCHGALADA